PHSPQKMSDGAKEQPHCSHASGAPEVPDDTETPGSGVGAATVNGRSTIGCAADTVPAGAAATARPHSPQNSALEGSSESQKRHLTEASPPAGTASTHYNHPTNAETPPPSHAPTTCDQPQDQTAIHQ